MFNKKVVSLFLAATLISSSVFTGSVTVPVSAASISSEAIKQAVAEWQWKSSAFGQSTDLNFSSTIAADKLGKNEAIEKKISVLKADGSTEEKSAIEIESRGGKIGTSHDGLTFYYVKVPTDQNFKLTANVYVNQLGPEASINKSASLQEAVGLMVRDVNGADRKDPMEFGYEEVPAASNIVASMVMSTAKTIGAPYCVKAISRKGVTQPYGNPGIEAVSTKGPTLSPSTWTKDSSHVTTTEKSDYKEEDFFTLGLERTDSGFIVSYGEEGSSDYKEQVIDGATIVEVQDEGYMYVGLYASRNAKATFTDVNLTTSEAHTQDYTYVAKEESLVFKQQSSNTANSEDYTVRSIANFDGTVTVEQNGKVIAENLAVKQGEFFELDTKLDTDSTTFNLTLTYGEETATKSGNLSFTVTKDEKFAKQDLYVSPTGSSSGDASKENPIDLETAVKYLSEGYTIYALEGTYGALKIGEAQSGAADAIKSLKAAEGAKVVFEGTSTLDASNWHIQGIEVTKSSTTGFRITGHNNTIEDCKFYENGDTGLQISTSTLANRSLWPKNNLVKNCDSYYNRDTSGINADGFAAKLGVGAGNVFEGCVSHNNADDGWDLYQKIDGTANEPVTIKNCIAYENGIVPGYAKPTVGSIGNGFKLGGEGLPVAHVIENSIAYNNNMDGFTCNFNPGKIVVTNCTSYDNARANYIFRTSPYFEAKDQGIFTNNVSYRSNENHKTSDFVSGNNINSYFFNNGNSVSENDFQSTDLPASWNRDADNNLVYGSFLRLTKSSSLNYAGKDGDHVGALKATKVFASSVTVNEGNKTLEVGATADLTATIAPAKADNKAVVWTSKNPSVATVDQATGKVTAVKAGTAVLVATAADGSKVSDSIVVTVVEKAVVAPSQVTSVTTATTTNSVTLSWTAAANATGYDVYAYNTATKRYVKVATTNQTTAVVNTIANTALTEGGKYQFFVRAFNSAAAGTAYAEDSAVVEVQTAIAKPAQVTGVKTSSEKTGSVKLSWNKSKGATSYQVYAYNSSTKKYVKVATTSATNTTISKISGKALKAGTTYKFYVKAVKTVNGTSVDASRSTILTSATAPAKVSLTVKAGTKKATVSWKKVSGATGYQVYKYNYKTKKYVKVKTITKSSTVKFTHNNLTKGTTAKYKVRAYKKVNGKTIYGAYSSVKSVKVK